MEKFSYTDVNLRRLQMVELEMLIEVDRICRRNDITYIIDAGTLLGAVRHGGFIPWDDDIDIRMYRSEYDRFCEACEKELDKKFFLQTYKTDPGYLWGYTRILRNGTKYLRKDHEAVKSRNGIFIDIFPNDNLPDGGMGKGYCSAVSWMCRKLLYSGIGKDYAPSLARRAGFRFLSRFPKKWGHCGIEHLIKKYGKEETDLVRCFGWGSEEETGGFQKKWLLETVDIKFEGVTVKAPLDTAGFLEHSFGPDFMTPPPEEERTPRHAAWEIKFPEEDYEK
ncbi:MAG: LicD family protein [Lachnospiraceae bacterium]|nr:LicD family protein [Lachnospiraceae bacterium]